MKIKYCALVFMIFQVFYTHGQLDLTLTGTDHLWQKNLINPSFQTDDNLTISLPALQFGFYHSGDPFKDVWKVEGNTLFIDTKEWLDNLDERNDVFSQFELPTLHLAHRSGDMVWSIGHTFRNNAVINYRKDLISLVHEGNATMIGESMDLDTDVEWTSFSAFHFGLSWEIDNLTVGGRFSYLSGIQYLDTPQEHVSLYTDEEAYQLEFNTDYKIRSSSFITAEDLSALNFEFTGLETFKLFTKNSGMSVDLGATLKFGDNWKAEASVLDLGFINWKDVASYRSQGTFVYEGVEVDDLADFDSLSFEETLDTIGNILGFEEVEEDDFRQNLSPRVYLGLSWQISPAWSVRGVYANASIRDEGFSAFGLGTQYEILDWWHVGTMVSRKFERWHWGFNTDVRLGFVQVYFATDNVLSVFDVKNLSSGNLRLGANLVFAGD